jgi:hypothetical protein
MYVHGTKLLNHKFNGNSGTTTTTATQIVHELRSGVARWYIFIKNVHFGRPLNGKI